jgi:hypothetical protein
MLMGESHAEGKLFGDKDSHQKSLFYKGLTFSAALVTATHAACQGSGAIQQRRDRLTPYRTCRILAADRVTEIVTDWIRTVVNRGE